LGLEDLFPAPVERADRAQKIYSRSQVSSGSGRACGSGVGSARRNLVRVAGRVAAPLRASLRHGVPLAGSPADGNPAEKKSLHAAERDTEANHKRREEFVHTLGSIPRDKLIFLDESGVSTQMTRLYARCQGGARIHESTPDSRWKILTILGALSTRGMVATMTVEAATDREIFLAYLDRCLCPQLRSGDVVVMDNLSSHKVDGVRQRIEKCGAELLYLPPYSPDLNPIEKAWAKLKQLLRTSKARTKKALDKAISRLLPQLTDEDAKAWFRLPFEALQQ